MKKTGIMSALIAAVILVCTAGAAPADEFLRERARNLYEVQDYRGAYNLFERLLEENPEDGEALDYSAWCLRYFGDWKSAEERFRMALDAPSGALVSWLYVGLGETLLGAADERGAIKSFGQAMDAAPDDTELVLRSLKGIAWANAFLGDADGLEAAISSTREKDRDYADDLEKDVRPVLEERTAAAAGSDEADEIGIEVLDTRERQAKIYEEEVLGDELDEIIAGILGEQEKPGEPEEIEEPDEPEEPKEIEEIEEIEEPEEPKESEELEEPGESEELEELDEPEEPEELGEPEEPKEPEKPEPEKKPEETPVRKPVKKPATEKPAAEKPKEEVQAPVAPPSSVWGVRVGEPIEREFDRAEAEVVKLDREGVEDANGVIRYSFTPKENPFPSYVRSQAASTYYAIEAYRGNILKVHGSVKTKTLPNTLEWRKNTFDAMVAEFSGVYGKPAILTDQGIFFEAAWLLPERRVLWVFVDAGLDGACQVQLSYVDRRIQAGHLIGILK